jgi:hypothetical protein
MITLYSDGRLHFLAFHFHFTRPPFYSLFRAFKLWPFVLEEENLHSRAFDLQLQHEPLLTPDNSGQRSTLQAPSTVAVSDYKLFCQDVESA